MQLFWISDSTAMLSASAGGTVERCWFKFVSLSSNQHWHFYYVTTSSYSCYKANRELSKHKPQPEGQKIWYIRTTIVCPCTHTHYPCGQFLMLLWQPISFDMTVLETLTPHRRLIFLPRRGDSVMPSQNHPWSIKVTEPDVWRSDRSPE